MWLNVTHAKNPCLGVFVVKIHHANQKAETFCICGKNLTSCKSFISTSAHEQINTLTLSLTTYISHTSPIQLGATSGFLINFILIAKKYNLQPTQIANTDSKNIKSKHTKHKIQAG